MEDSTTPSTSRQYMPDAAAEFEDRLRKDLNRPQSAPAGVGQSVFQKNDDDIITLSSDSESEGTVERNGEQESLLEVIYDGPQITPLSSFVVSAAAAATRLPGSGGILPHEMEQGGSGSASGTEVPSKRKRRKVKLQQRIGPAPPSYLGFQNLSDIDRLPSLSDIEKFASNGTQGSFSVAPVSTARTNLRSGRKIPSLLDGEGRRAVSMDRTEMPRAEERSRKGLRAKATGELSPAALADLDALRRQSGLKSLPALNKLGDILRAEEHENRDGLSRPGQSLGLRGGKVEKLKNGGERWISVPSTNGTKEPSVVVSAPGSKPTKKQLRAMNFSNRLAPRVPFSSGHLSVTIPGDQFVVEHDLPQASTSTVVDHSPTPPDEMSFADQIIKITDAAFWLLITDTPVAVAGYARVSCFAGNPEIAGFRMSPSTREYVIPSLDCESLVSIHSLSPPLEISQFVAYVEKFFDLDSVAMRALRTRLAVYPNKVRAVLLVNSTNSVSDGLLWHFIKLFPHLMPRAPDLSRPSVVELARMPASRTYRWLFPGCCLYDSAAQDVVYTNYQNDRWKQVGTEVDKLASLQGAVILVCGEKNTGKSTSVRYIVNRLLREHEAVQCFDCDVGQSECSPPGAISIHTFRQPLFGPSFTHMQRPDTSCYTGDVSPATRKQVYLSAVRHVWQTGRNPRVPVVVNTMGWMEGFGLEALRHIVETCRPNLIFELAQTQHSSTASLAPVASEFVRGERYGPCSLVHVRAPLGDGAVKSQFNPAFRRKMLVVAYLSAVSPDLGPINSVVPHRISFDDAHVHFADAKLPSSHFLLTLIGSYVGLAKFDDKGAQRGFAPERCPDSSLQVLRHPPVASTLGYGVVRAVDRVRRLLYVLTPLSAGQLQECNLLIRGTILTPEEIFLGQELGAYQGLLPRVQYRYAFEE